MRTGATISTRNKKKKRKKRAKSKSTRFENYLRIQVNVRQPQMSVHNRRKMVKLNVKMLTLMLRHKRTK